MAFGLMGKDMHLVVEWELICHENLFVKIGIIRLENIVLFLLFALGLGLV
jgi:hypothetical protein